MKLSPIKVKDIVDGDIIYTDLDIEFNDCALGYDYIITGKDMILIIDDASRKHENCFLVNGGYEFFIFNDTPIYKLGHYSEIIKQIEQ